MNFEMNSEIYARWWTSAVAYLPHGPAEAIQKRAQLAGKAWLKIHAQPSDDEEDGEENMRDLWEEKHYAGMEKRGEDVAVVELPDWEIIEARNSIGMACPPFFAAEAEELPRGSAIEWHAHLGITNGPVKVSVVQNVEVGY